MEQSDRIISVYLKISQIYQILTKEHPLRRGGFAPALSDEEVLTMEIIGEMSGHNGDRAIWRYFKTHWNDWFPRLSAYKTFAKHCANLCWIKHRIMEALFPSTDTVHIIDGVPMPVCHKARAYRSTMMDTLSAWGYCAAKDEHYYGMRGHLVLGLNRLVSAFVVTPADVDERESLWDLTGKIKGMLIGDKGFIGQDWKDKMAAHDIDIQTPLRKNMPDKRPKHAVKRLLYLRKYVETVLSVLVDKFNLTNIKAHDLWHFNNKLTRKLLAYNFDRILS